MARKDGDRIYGHVKSSRVRDARPFESLLHAFRYLLFFESRSSVTQVQHRRYLDDLKRERNMKEETRMCHRVAQSATAKNVLRPRVFGNVHP